MLPRDFLPWQTTYGYFRRYRIDGTWEQIHGVLRESVREMAGREKTPSAAIIDSQSVKTTEKGGSADTTQERKSPGVNATLLLTLWDLSLRLLSMPQIFKTATAQSWFWKDSKVNSVAFC
jgi:putative transposase